MQALLDVIVPVFLVIGAGYLAVWRGYFTEGGVDALMKFTQNFAIPCLLFLALSRIDLSTRQSGSNDILLCANSRSRDRYRFGDGKGEKN